MAWPGLVNSDASRSQAGNISKSTRLRGAAGAESFSPCLTRTAVPQLWPIFAMQENRPKLAKSSGFSRKVGNSDFFKCEILNL